MKKHESILEIIEALCSTLQGIFDPHGSADYAHRSLIPQHAAGNILAPGFDAVTEVMP
jgi:hypothetical protein